jgi:hypothetical protein
MKPVVYISGPMTGYENFNFAAFNEAADKLRRLGYPVVNPADFGANPNATWKDCLVRDLNAMAACDVVLVLPGWKKSSGAKLEVHVARAYGTAVISYSDFYRKAEQNAVKEKA